MLKVISNSAPPSELSSFKRIIVGYPGGNTTVLIEDEHLLSHVPTVSKHFVDKTTTDFDLPLKQDLLIEQCGVISRSDTPNSIGKLRMPADEFCGNAARTAILALSKGTPCTGILEVIGLDQPVQFEVFKENNIKVQVPFEQVKKEGDDYLVFLTGMTHIVNFISGDPANISDDLFTEQAQEKFEHYNLNNQKGCGFVLFNPKSLHSKFFVKIPATNSWFIETACGSGTCAIGIALSKQHKTATQVNVTQPSGRIITAETQYQEGAPTKAFIQGLVDILYDSA